MENEILKNHTITVSSFSIYGRSYLLKCNCGLLHIDVVEEDVGRLIRIHWDVVKRRG